MLRSALRSAEAWRRHSVIACIFVKIAPFSPPFSGALRWQLRSAEFSAEMVIFDVTPLFELDLIGIFLPPINRGEWGLWGRFLLHFYSRSCRVFVFSSCSSIRVPIDNRSTIVPSFYVSFLGVLRYYRDIRVIVVIVEILGLGFLTVYCRICIPVRFSETLKLREACEANEKETQPTYSSRKRHALRGERRN